MRKSVRLFATVMVCMVMALCVSCKKDDAEPSGGGISGCFSVSPTTTVEFAPGNLYWDGSAFKFEENQYSSVSTWNASHVSHFKWSDAVHAVTVDYGYSGELFCANNFTVTGDSHTWRTLSKDEWFYLTDFYGHLAGDGKEEQAESRPDAMAKCAWKELDGGMHKGLVILPDDTDASVMSSITSVSDLAPHCAALRMGLVW